MNLFRYSEVTVLGRRSRIDEMFFLFPLVKLVLTRVFIPSCEDTYNA